MAEAFTKKDAEEFKEDIKKIIEENTKEFYKYVTKTVEKNRKEFQKYTGIVSEDYQHKLNLAIDGLTGKIESMEERLNSKIDSVAKDLRKEIREVKDELISHRDNTEAHTQKVKTKKRA